VPEELVDLAARLASAVQRGDVSVHDAERQLGRRAFERLLPADGVLESRHADAQSPSTIGDSELAAVLRHLAELGDPVDWKPAPEYRSMALSVLDAIWSIGVRYGGVLNVIARYSAARVEQGADPQVDTPSDLVAFIDGCGSAEEFAASVANRQRTSSTNGILKADAVRQAATLLVTQNVETPAVLRSLDSVARQRLEERWRGIRGQASGLSWDYFVMLNGMSGVKADRMIRRFVAEALDLRESDVPPARARTLVVAASDELGIDARVTDFAVWEAMSARKLTAIP
jgi:hypothetical protein